MSAFQEYLEYERRSSKDFGNSDYSAPIIQSTTQLAAGQERRVFDDPTVLKPSPWRKLPEYGILLSLLWIWWRYLRALIAHSSDAAGIAFYFLSVFIFTAIITFFARRRKHPVITFSSTGLSIDDRYIPWSDIDGTAIRSVRVEKDRFHYLVIVQKDKSIEEIELRYYFPSHEKISVIIQSFRRHVTH
jgi:hypothetical protein